MSWCFWMSFVIQPNSTWKQHKAHPADGEQSYSCNFASCLGYYFPQIPTHTEGFIVNFHFFFHLWMWEFINSGLEFDFRVQQVVNYIIQ